MADYSNTVIYILHSTNRKITQIYVGGTGNFTKRKYNHKYSCTNKSKKNEKYNRKVYTFIRQNGGYSKWEFTILETANLKSKKEAKELERHYIETLKPELNENFTGQTPDELIKKQQQLAKVWADNNPNYKRDWRKKSEIFTYQTCNCGDKFRLCDAGNHMDSKKHKNYIISMLEKV
tara:strand:- start:2615 stop:3145 length:531 start_codon:yes stop_codon:yes gene_type:complete